MKLEIPLRNETHLLAAYALFDCYWWSESDTGLQGAHKALFPFVVSALKRTQDEVVSLNAVAGEIDQMLGLRLPAQVLRGILKTAYRRGLLTKTSDSSGTYFVVDRAKLGLLPDIEQKKEELLQHHGVIIRELRNFSRIHFNRQLSRRDAEVALHTLLIERIDRISTIKDYTSIADESPEGLSPRDTGYIVRRFIEEEVRPETDLHCYMNRIVKGSALAVSIFYEGDQVERLGSSMRGLDVFYDTPLLLSLLGYHTEQDRAAAFDLHELVTSSGAQPCVLQHTLVELRNVLHGAVRDMRGANHGLALESTMPVVETFISRTLEGERGAPSRSRYIVDAEQIRTKLQHEFNFTVRQARSSHTVDDEQHVKKVLEGQYASDPSRRLYDFDSKSLLEIRHRRHSGTFYSLAESAAILVTTNPRLAKAGDLAFDTKREEGEIPFCYTSDALANLLWLKRPLDRPDVPWQQVVSYCFAGLYPDDELWKRYTEILDALRDGADPITEDEYFILRFTVGARQALMDDTLGDPDLLTIGKISHILDEARDRLNHQLGSDLDRTQGALAATREELAGLQGSFERQSQEKADLTKAIEEMLEHLPLERRAGLRSGLEVESQRIAHRARRTLEVLVVISILAGIFLAIVSAIAGGPVPPMWALTVTALATLVSCLGFLNISDGWTFRQFEDSLARRLTDSREKRVLREIGHPGQTRAAQKPEGPGA